ncbi:MAG TPA: hypothetical protein VE010_22690, partial [Thermoanaerobaculia bacterium]|nr:hypothetical protein [Thermoanaerobaculia bacterium]
MKRLLPLLFLLTACVAPRLDLPAGAYDVSGSNPRRWTAPLSFGEWRTERVDEGTRRSWLSEVGVVQIARADQGYHLAMNGVSVECHTKEFAIGAGGLFVDPTFGSTPLLVCGYDRGGERSVLTLHRTGRIEPMLRGTFRDDDGNALEVRSLHRSVGAKVPAGEAYGFELMRGEERVAVVETVNRGRVWIDPDAPNRDTLAATAAS